MCSSCQDHTPGNRDNVIDLASRREVRDALRMLEAGAFDDDEEPGPQRRSRMPQQTEKIHALYEPIVAWFAAGNRVTLSDDTAFSEHLASLKTIPGLEKAVEEHFAPATPEELAIGMELVLEGLTQHLKIAREDLDSRVSYAEMLKFNLVKNRVQ